MGFLTWRMKPGERTLYYRMADNAWMIAINQEIAGINAFLELTRKGMSLFGPGNERIRQAHAAFAWMGKVFDNAPPFENFEDLEGPDGSDGSESENS
jgi:hypothetical protein